MNTQLQLPSGVDKLSVPQKVVAGGLMVGALYFTLPILLTLMTNLVMVLLIGVPLAFLAYNYQMIWLLFKNISWRTTQALIGLDVLGYMDRYLEWVGQQREILVLSKRDLVKELETVTNEVNQREKSYKENMKRADTADGLGNDKQRDISLSAAQDDENYIATLAPIKIDAEKQVEYLTELTDVFDTKYQQLEYTIKSQKSKYRSLKAMSKGMKAASNVMGQAGGANQLWQETNNQLISQMNQFTANIKMFEDTIKPALETSRFDKQLRQQEGKVLLENFRKTNFQLTTDK